MKSFRTVFAAILLTACGTPLFSERTTTPDPVIGIWNLTSARGNGTDLGISTEHPITMSLNGVRIVGNAGCNTYSGSYSIDTDGSIQMPGGFAVTEMACQPSSVMDTELTYLKMLRAATHIQRSGNQLTLHGENVELVFELDEDAGPPPPANGNDNPDQPVSN